MKNPTAILALCLLAGCCLAHPGNHAVAATLNASGHSSPPAQQLAPMTDFQKGIAYASWWHGEYSTAESDRIISQSIKPLKANWLQIIVTCYQEKTTSTHIQCKPESRTPTDADLKHVIRDAHRSGLRVMLKPHVDVEDDAFWRGTIGFARDETAWKAWFKSYTNFITYYAKLAQQTDTDYFVVGTELANTTHRSGEWRDIIKAIRNVYSGPLTYAAHHEREVFAIDWWDDLNAIGLNPYYPLAQNAHPTVAQIKSSWTPIIKKLGQLSNKWDRKIIFTEIGYQSIEGTVRAPWGANSFNIEFEEQADSYQALFEAFEGQPWWQGIFWWVWRANSLRVEAFNGDYHPCNKPAEKILGRYFEESPCMNNSPKPEQNNRLPPL